MIYLGVSPWVNYETMEYKLILKIGYTEDGNRDRRLIFYTSHNRCFKFLVEISGGTELHEAKLHYKFKKYLIEGREWFADVPEIREFFKNCTLKDIDNLPNPPRKENYISKLDIRYPKIEITNEMNSKIKEFFIQWNSAPTVYVKRIKMICDFILLNPEFSDTVINNLSDSDKIKQQLIVVGPERIASLGYNLTRINREMGITIFDKSSFDSEIFSYFKPGERYTKKYIKEILGSIYKAADFQGTAKANDLENWFEIRDMKVTVDGKQQAGFEILSIKQQ